jgi:uncharacterized protein (TIGR00255 family)
MAISGMTGFGRSDGAVAGRRWIWEVRSVNGRGLDFKVRLPGGLEALEPVAREAAAQRFKRGSIQATLTITRDAEAGGGAMIDHAFVAKLLEAGAPYAAEGRVALASWSDLLQVRGVLVFEETPEDAAETRAAIEASAREGIAPAFDALAAARAQEGRVLTTVLEGIIARVEALTAAAEGHAALAPAALAVRLQERLAALAPEVQFDSQRLAQEAALLATKADVREELERLKAHADEARALIRGPDAAGRRLDFLSQELNREANTVCSKSSDLALTRIGLDLKTAIDQFREQCANAE